MSSKITSTYYLRSHSIKNPKPTKQETVIKKVARRAILKKNDSPNLSLKRKKILVHPFTLKEKNLFYELAKQNGLILTGKGRNKTQLFGHCKSEYNKKAKILGYPERTYKSIEGLYFKLRTSQTFYQATLTTGTKVDDGSEDVTENTTLDTHSDEEAESFPPINAISGECSVDAMGDKWDPVEEGLFTDPSGRSWQESNSDFCDDESVDFHSEPNGSIL